MLSPQTGLSSKTGLKTNFIVEGQGPPIVLVHGFAGSLRQWEMLIPRLVAEGYQVLAPDLLGHGDSAKPHAENGYHIEAVYAHFFDWLGQQPLAGPPILLGHSMGAYISLNYALRSGQPLRGMILVNPYYSNHQLQKLARLSLYGKKIGPLILKAIPGWTIRSALRLSNRPGNSLPPRIQEQIADDYKRIDPGIINLPRSLRDLTPLLPRLRQPVVVAWGENDYTLVSDTFPTMCQKIPIVHMERLPGGHAPHLSHPETFNRGVVRYLRQMPN
jgi:pimeloyl-ACP methyl ester carboxylesterase